LHTERNKFGLSDMEDQRQLTSTLPSLDVRVRALMRLAPCEAEEEHFNRLALEIFAVQFAGAPIYGEFCAARGVAPNAIQHWTQIPTLPTSAFKEHLVSSLPENERSRVFHSSGTTGHAPSRHFHSGASMALYETSVLAGIKWNLAFSPSFFIFLTPLPAAAPHSSLVHMFETIRQRLGEIDSFYAGGLESDGAWSLDFARLTSSLKMAISNDRPVGLLGTTFSFVHLLDHLAEGKIRLRLPPRSWAMETGGYKGRSRVVAKIELRRLITKHLGLAGRQIVTEYGMSELSSQAYDIGTGLFQFPPWVRTRIISPETGAVAAAGETGLLRIFDLANLYSVAALQTEDLAIQREGGFELLGRPAWAEPRGCSLMAAT